MASITIKDISEDLLERLRRRAAEDRRSMNGEILHLLDLALSGVPAGPEAAETARCIDAQIRAWRPLAGRWESDVDPAEEVERIYAARTAGRPGHRQSPAL